MLPTVLALDAKNIVGTPKIGPTKVGYISIVGYIAVRIHILDILYSFLNKLK